MFSENQIEESGVSGPLKHLLSIDWKNALEIPSEMDSKEVRKNRKQCKKVRFADEQVRTIEIDDIQACDTDLSEYNEYETFIEIVGENDSPIVENSLECESEKEKTLSHDEKGEAGMITEICAQLDDMMSGENSLVDGSIEMSKTLFPLESQNELATIYKNERLNSSDVNIIDAGFESWRAPNESEQTHPWKMAVKRSIIGKQSSKINSLLEKNNFTYLGATEIQRAVFQAWCKVKDEQKLRKTEKTNFSMSKSNEKEKKTAIDSAYLRWRKSKQAQRKMNIQSKTNPDSSTDTAVQKNKEESEAVFKMWKRKKDAILMKNKAEAYRLEQEGNLNSLMNAELRKEEAELAYAAWKYHKDELLKREKQKQDWMQLKKREKDLMRHKRNEEALNVYLEWLEKKIYLQTCAKQEEIIAEDLQLKPPWYPPNKI